MIKELQEMPDCVRPGPAVKVRKTQVSRSNTKLSVGGMVTFVPLLESPGSPTIGVTKEQHHVVL
jgi:hypothetical protein